MFNTHEFARFNELKDGDFFCDPSLPEPGQKTRLRVKRSGTRTQYYGNMPGAAWIDERSGLSFENKRVLRLSVEFVMLVTGGR